MLLVFFFLLCFFVIFSLFSTFQNWAVDQDIKVGWKNDPWKEWRPDFREWSCSTLCNIVFSCFCRCNGKTTIRKPPDPHFCYQPTAEATTVVARNQKKKTADKKPQNVEKEVRWLVPHHVLKRVVWLQWSTSSFFHAQHHPEEGGLQASPVSAVL